MNYLSVDEGRGEGKIDHYRNWQKLSVRYTTEWQKGKAEGYIFR